MSAPLKTAVRSAMLRLLQPLARLLLKVGVGAGEFQRLVHEAYVRAAQEMGREAGVVDRPNITQIAVQTGLSRGEVTRILESKGQDAPESDRNRKSVV